MSVARRGLKMPSRQWTNTTVKAGVLENATYPADMIRNAETGAEYPDPRAGMKVASIAAALHYGVGQNHPRPFIQQTVAQRKTEWRDAVVKLFVNGVPVRDAMMTVGQIMKEDIKKTISDWPADNAESWARVKGFNAGLRFTGHLLNSVESEVESK